MAKNKNLNKANKAKNDEFYTQYNDIQNELNAYIAFNENTFRDKVILLPCDDPEWSNFTKFFAQNFERYGIKKLISTSYAASSNKNKEYYQVSLFEQESPKYDEKKTKTHGKMFVLDRDKNKSGRIDIYDLDFEYLEGDGDFRSEEVRKLREEADIIITNPPFSLFREFMEWIMEVDKDFLVIGNQNAITYKEIFPLLKENKMWLGVTSPKQFIVMQENEERSNIEKKDDGKMFANFGNICWFTNLDHGRRHQPLQLMTMADNIMYNQKLKGKDYEKYDNYTAIEIPAVITIPSDYSGIMGVPITFLNKYNPDQFDIIGMDYEVKDGLIDEVIRKGWDGKLDRAYLNGKRMYARILIRWKKDAPGYTGK